MDQEIHVRVMFEFLAGKNGDPPAFRDALYFTPDEYAAVTQAEIDRMKQERYLAWLEVIRAPAPEPAAEVTNALDVATQLVELAQRATQLAQRVSEGVETPSEEPVQVVSRPKRKLKRS